MTSIDELLSKLRDTGADYIIRITDTDDARNKEILLGKLDDLVRTYQAIEQYTPKRKH